ncbi:MAG: hypothetical protein HYS16_01535 [Deltaproteobacteria bacterium]|nr:MAG: hypothetical protein HYS16_01535 [Deltaproteobacteria bacterium]
MIFSLLNRHCLSYIGQILKPYGTKGGFFILSNISFNQLPLNKTMIILPQNLALNIKKAIFPNLIYFKEIDSRSKIAHFISSYLFIQEPIQTLPISKFRNLIGMKVVTINNHVLGFISSIIERKMQCLIELNDSNLIPFTYQFISLSGLKKNKIITCFPISSI